VINLTWVFISLFDRPWSLVSDLLAARAATATENKVAQLHGANETESKAQAQQTTDHGNEVDPPEVHVHFVLFTWPQMKSMKYFECF
jgi:hypothetical protein